MRSVIRSARPAAIGRALATAVLCATLAGALTGCDGTDPVSPNVASAERLAQVGETLAALEEEKVLLAFGTEDRTPTQVERFLSMYAPEFRSINLGPSGVSQTTYADLEPMLASFPSMPYEITNMRAITINPNSSVVTYQVALETPMGTVNYLASSTWALTPSGQWRTVFYQATPL